MLDEEMMIMGAAPRSPTINQACAITKKGLVDTFDRTRWRQRRRPAAVLVPYSALKRHSKTGRPSGRVREVIVV